MDRRDDRTVARTGPTRRRVLAGLATAAVAGCVESDTVDGPVSEDPDVFAIPFQHDTSGINLNPWTAQYPVVIEPLFFEPLTLTTPEGTHHPTGLVADVQVDGRTATVTYDEDHSWWSGEPVTARDRFVDERIQSYVSRLDGEQSVDLPSDPATATDPRPGGTGIDRVSLDDEYTIEYTFESELSRELALDRVLGRAHNVAAWRFDQWLERLEDAGSGEDVESTVSELRGDTISLDAAMSEGYGYGPYELTEVSVNRLVLDPFPDHPRSDELGIPRLWLPVARERQTSGLLRDGVLDGGTGLLEDRATDPADNLAQLAAYDSNLGVKLACNWGNPHLARREVRRALCCLVPFEELQSIGRWGDPPAVQTGLTAPARRRWLDDAFHDRLHRYPLASDPEAAARHMRSAGYERSDGSWVSEGGRVASFSLRTPIRPSWSGPMEQLHSLLVEFGLDVTYDEFTGATFAADVLEGNFGVAPWIHDGRPRRAYQVTPDGPDLGVGVGAVGGGDRFASSTTVPTPAEPGTVSAEGEEVDLDLGEQWRRIRSGSPDDARPAVERIAAWWNAAVPDLVLATGRTGVWGNTRDFDWPDGDDPRYRRSGPSNRPELALVVGGGVRPSGDGREDEN